MLCRVSSKGDSLSFIYQACLTEQATDSPREHTTCIEERLKFVSMYGIGMKQLLTHNSQWELVGWIPEAEMIPVTWVNSIYATLCPLSLRELTKRLDRSQPQPLPGRIYRPEYLHSSG